MTKYTLFYLVLCISLQKLNAFCVAISGQKIVTSSSKGQSLQQSVKTVEAKYSRELDELSNCIQKKEKSLLDQRRDLKTKSDELEKKRLAEVDGNKLEVEELALHQLVDAFEKEYQELMTMERDFKHKIDESKNTIKQKQYQELAAFDKDVVQRYAPLKDWDIVFARESNHVLYSNKKSDKTDELLTSLEQQQLAKNRVYITKKERQELFKDLGLVYLDSIKIDSGLKGDINGFYTPFYDDNKTSLDINTKKYLSFVKQQYCGPIAVQWISDKVGYGVIATEDIKQGEFIQEYTGILHAAQLRGGLVLDDTTYAWVYPSVGEYQNNLLVNSKYEGNETRFVNHGNHPNVMQIKLLDEDGIFHICYIAKEDIKAGEQLLISYGVDYWTTREFFEDL